MKKRVKFKTPNENTFVISKISCCNFFPKNRRGQVWVETVIYTLVALAMIGLVLTFAKPKIEEIQDKALIEQSIKMIEDIDILIMGIVQGGSGNKRLLEVGIKKGVLKIDGENDKIVFEIEGKHSEPGVKIEEGNLEIYTEKKGELHLVTITRDYNGIYNITYNGADKLKSITKSSTSYKLLISNEGGDLIRINIEVN